MRRRLTARVLHLAAVLLAVSIVTFALGRLLPGDPAQARLGPDATTRQLARLRRQLGLDRPLWVQFWRWLDGVLHGDLGTSTVTGQDVAHTLFERFPVSLELVVLTELMVLGAAVPAALLAAWRRGSRRDRLANRLSFVMLAVPQFCLAVVLIDVFAVRLHWLPATGYRDLSDGVAQNIRSLILPAGALAAGLTARAFRVLRGDLIETLGADFVRTARAKGVSSRQLLCRHALVPSLPTLLALVGIDFGWLLGGAVMVEEMFGLPGLGSFAVDAVTNRDFPSLQGVVLVITATYVVVNFGIELLQLRVDPRTRDAS